MRFLTFRNLNRFLAGCILILVVYVAYTLFAPINPATLKYLVVPTNQLFQAGAQLSYRTSACRYVGTNVQTTSVRSLVPKSQPGLQPISLTTDISANEPGCHTNTRQIIIPTGTPAGCYQLSIKVIYVVEPFRAPIAREIHSNTFCIKVPAQADQLIQVQSELNTLEQAIQALQKTGGGAITPTSLPITSGDSSTSSSVPTANVPAAAAEPQLETQQSSAPGSSPQQTAPAGLLEATSGTISGLLNSAVKL